MLNDPFFIDWTDDKLFATWGMVGDLIKADPLDAAETCEGFDRCRCQIRLELKPGAELGSEVDNGS